MGLKERVDNLFEKQRRIEESLRLKKLKKEETARAVKEEKLRITTERNLLLIEKLNKLPIREFLTEIRDEEWKLGEVVAVPGEPKIRLIAKWPRVIPDHQDEIYETADIGEEFVGYKPVAGWVESQGEVIEISARWANIDNSKKQVFYSLDNLLPEFCWFENKHGLWFSGDNGRRFFTASMIRKMTDGSYPEHWEGYDQSGSSLPEKKKIVLYGHAVGWQTNLLYEQNLNLEEHQQNYNYYGGFEGPSINDPNIVSKIEESLIKMCFIRRKENFPPPLDRYKKECELEAIRLVNAGRCQRGFGNISSKEIKKMFT